MTVRGGGNSGRLASVVREAVDVQVVVSAMLVEAVVAQKERSDELEVAVEALREPLTEQAERADKLEEQLDVLRDNTKAVAEFVGKPDLVDPKPVEDPKDHDPVDPVDPDVKPVDPEPKEVT